MAFNLGDMGGLVKQAQDMQKRMKALQKEMKERVVEAASGGGAVTAQASGARELVAIKLNKDVVDPSDIGMLEDLILTAVNAALKKAEELHEKEMSKITGGLNIPGLM